MVVLMTRVVSEDGRRQEPVLRRVAQNKVEVSREGGVPGTFDYDN